MSNFEEWFLSNGIPLDTDFNVAKRAFEAGQQSQQAKIDLLEKELTETQAFLNNQNHIKQAKIDELQSRVDAIEKWVNKEKFVPTETWLTEDIVFVDELIDILKGNKDENY